MKYCLDCSSKVADEATSCPICGSANLGSKLAQEKTRENVLSGAVGAFLLALGGAVVYFILYQLGFVAWISALVTYTLAVFGYALFTHTRGQESKTCRIVAVIVTLVMMVLAEYICIAFEIFTAFGAEYDINIFDAMLSVPAFLEEPEVMGAFASDLGFMLVVGIASFIYDVMRARKAAR